MGMMLRRHYKQRDVKQQDESYVVPTTYELPSEQSAPEPVETPEPQTDGPRRKKKPE